MNIAAYPKHDSFKPSGFDWVGDVPEHWDVEKLGSMLTAVSEKNRPDLPLLSITREKGVIERDVEDQDSNHNFIPDDLSGYKVLRKGQFGMNKMKAWQGSYGVSAYTGIVSPAYFIFDFAREVDPHFFNIAIRSKLYVSYFGSASDGVRVGQWDLNQSRMRKIPILLPPLPEQRAIAAFLDGKCATIDEAVRIKEEQIRLLAERRQILIQQAVTRGLNPAAPMKDSGIDWIGQIPAHWEVKRLKHVALIRYGLGQPPRESQQGLPLIRATNVERGKINRENLIHVEEKDVPKGRNAFLEVGEIIVVRSGAYTGDSAIIPEEYAGAVAGYDMVVTAKQILPEFLSFSMLTPYVLHEQLFLLRMRAAQPHLNREELGETLLLVPPQSEQRTISEYATRIGEKLDQAVLVKRSQITALREYKTSLINAAVTGKIKVI